MDFSRNSYYKLFIILQGTPPEMLLLVSVSKRGKPPQAS